MSFDFASPLDRLQTALTLGIRRETLPWVAEQGVLILVTLGLAFAIARRVEPALEARARRIRNQPGLLRVIAAFLRRLHWLVFAALLVVALAASRALAPLPPTLVQTALLLGLSWFLAAGLSRAVRNRTLARAVSWGIWVFAALVILGLSDDTAALLDDVALPVGASRLSLLTVGKGLVWLALTVWVAVVAGNALDARVRKAEDFSPAARVLFGKVAKIGLVLVAGTVALSAAGIDLTTFTVLTGAVGVGLGFGLQKVISNFISGIIILADRSIKPGDTITVGETFGWIRELRARFVSVITRDGREYLIPNEDFITTRVVNWSFTDEFVRLDVTFGVSYDSDPHEVTRLAIQAAAAVPRVDTTHPPVCWITSFGESSLQFVLRFWIDDPQEGLTNVRGRVFLSLWDTFKANGIVLPYPVRDVILHTGEEGNRGAGIPYPANE